MKWFHSVVIVGFWKLEWTSAGVIIPRLCMPSSVLGWEVAQIVLNDPTREGLLDAIAGEVASYNVYKQYSQDTFNCQHMVDAFLPNLHTQIKSTDYFTEYITTLRENGQNECRYRVPEHILVKMKVKKTVFETMPEVNIEICTGQFVFTSHSQLDEVVQAIIAVDANYLFDNGKNDFKLLQMFDRAFWIRHYKHHAEHMNPHSDYQPLEFVSRCDNCCPFADPTENSVQNLETTSTVSSY